MKSFLDKINEIEKNKQFIPTVVKTNTNYATIGSLGANQTSQRFFDYLTNIITVHTIRDFYTNNPNSKLDLNDVYKLSKNNFVCTPNQLNKIKEIIALGVNFEKEFEIDNQKLPPLAVILKYFPNDTLLLEMILLNGADALHQFTIDGTQYDALTYVQECYTPTSKQKTLSVFEKFGYKPYHSISTTFNSFELMDMINSGATDQQVVEYMQKNNVDLMSNIKGLPVIERLAESQRQDAILQLAMSMPDINRPLFEGKHILTYIELPPQKHESEKILERLYKKGLNVNYQDKTTGKTLLMYACEKADKNLFDWLVDNRAMCDRLDYEYNDIWTYADNTDCYSQGICKILDRIYSKQTSIFIQSKNIQKALENQDALIKEMINYKTYRNVYATYMAEFMAEYIKSADLQRSKDATEVYKMLLNLPHTDLVPALNAAIETNQIEFFVEGLLQKGANANQIYNGKFPLERALINANQAMCQKLSLYGAKFLPYYTTDAFLSQCPKHSVETTKQILAQLAKTEKQETAYITPQKHYVDVQKSPNGDDIKKQIDDLFDKANSR